MLNDVVAVEARPEFKVWVRFENGVEGEADLSDLAGSGVIGSIELREGVVRFGSPEGPFRDLDI